jgi:hypothetical protein
LGINIDSQIDLRKSLHFHEPSPQCKSMKIFVDMRNMIRLERHHLPFISTLEDRDIATQIGYHDVIAGEPLTLKLLYLLDIGSIATVQRRLARLVGKGVVLKRRHDGDRRALTLHLTSSARREYQRFAAAVASHNGHGRGKQ